MKQKWTVPVVWKMEGEVEIEAESLDEAIQYAERNIDDIDLPEDAAPNGASFQVDGAHVDYNGCEWGYDKMSAYSLKR